MSKVQQRNERVAYVWMDFAANGWDLDGQGIGQLLHKLRHMRVQAIVLDVGWKAMSNVALIRFISAKFKNLHTLSFNGYPDSSVLYGLSSSDVSNITQCSLYLKRLSLTAYGNNSFSCSSLLTLLSVCKTSLQQLALSGAMLDELDLDAVGTEIGSTLETLTVRFAHIVGGTRMLGFAPVVKGSLAKFSRLRSFSLSDTGRCSGSRQKFPRNIVSSLIESIPESGPDLIISLHFSTHVLSDIITSAIPSNVACQRISEMYAIGISNDNRSQLIEKLRWLMKNCSRLRIIGVNAACKISGLDDVRIRFINLKIN
ncbi:hypothetical protein HDU82_007798 [Entophlyctis luteolus]|nr:hypothetical protein HDU82_007798 [Entophlyctis luteolus]